MQHSALKHSWVAEVPTAGPIDHAGAGAAETAGAGMDCMAGLGSPLPSTPHCGGRKKSVNTLERELSDTQERLRQLEEERESRYSRLRNVALQEGMDLVKTFQDHHQDHLHASTRRIESLEEQVKELSDSLRDKDAECRELYMAMSERDQALPHFPQPPSAIDSCFVAPVSRKELKASEQIAQLEARISKIAGILQDKEKEAEILRAANKGGSHSTPCTPARRKTSLPESVLVSSTEKATYFGALKDSPETLNPTKHESTRRALDFNPPRHSAAQGDHGQTVPDSPGAKGLPLPEGPPFSAEEQQTPANNKPWNPFGELVKGFEQHMSFLTCCNSSASQHHKRGDHSARRGVPNQSPLAELTAKRVEQVGLSKQHSGVRPGT